METGISLYDDFFDTFESVQYCDLKERFENDFQQNVVSEGVDFSREEWFRSTVAAALNNYFNTFHLGVVHNETN